MVLPTHNAWPGLLMGTKLCQIRILRQERVCRRQRRNGRTRRFYENGLSQIQATAKTTRQSAPICSRSETLRLCQTAWWAREDSNLQPDRYERSALTIELRAQCAPSINARM